LSTKVGPFPVYGWVAGIAIGGIGVWYWWHNRASNSASSTATSPADTSSAGGGDYAPEIATTQSEIQQLQGEESTTANQAEAATDRAAKLTKRANSQERQIKGKEDKPEPKRKPPARRPVGRGGGRSGPPAKRKPARKTGPVKR